MFVWELNMKRRFDILEAETIEDKDYQIKNFGMKHSFDISCFE